jgi:DNA (cytosine-5)-methyltransferase 1
LIPQAFGGGDTRGAIDASTCLTAHAGRMDFDSETFVAHTLRTEGFDASEDGTGRGTPLVPIAFNGRQDPDVTGDRAGALNGMSPQDQCVATGWAVRRLTPTECERLQGFPDGYTAIPYRGKPAADGPRYKALGNSWAVNCARWIGRRIELVEEVSAEIAAGVAAE